MCAACLIVSRKMLPPATADILLSFCTQGEPDTKKHDRNRFPPLHPFNIVIWMKVTFSFHTSTLSPVRHDTRAKSCRTNTSKSTPSITVQQIIGETDKGWTRLVFMDVIKTFLPSNNSTKVTCVIHWYKILAKIQVQEIFYSLTYLIYFFFNH